MGSTKSRLGFCLFFLVISTLACTQETRTITRSKDPPLPLPNEKTLCSATTNFAPNKYTITGKAIYKRRGYGGSGLTSTIDPTNYPIRHAEVEVRNSSGGQVQCSTTDANGDFSVDLPNNSNTYTIYINSRGDNTFVKASVQNNPTNFQHYNISRTVVSDSDKSIGTLIAEGDSSVVGGAFNIFDKIVEANNFLREMTINCSADFVDCPPFTVAPKVYAYWTLGLDPGQYVGSSGVSYYLPGRNQLFILGGSSGNYVTSDTDHFDDTIVLHEYGHFIEDKYAKTNSPGGFHDADSIVDPRLAWSEGWATFFALSVQKSSRYIDTSGINFMYLIDHDLEPHPSTASPRDIPQRAGEGNFREFSIVRALWDIVDPYTFDSVTVASTDGGGDSVDADFKELWTVFAGTNQFKSNNNHFRDYGLFMKLHAALGDAAKTDFSAIFARELQREDRLDYAAQDNVGSCADISIATSFAPTSPGAFSSSDIFGSNDFYQINHSGGTLTVNLTYDDDSNGATDPSVDLDFFIYKESYRYGDISSIVGSSSSTNDGGIESTSVSLNSGVYLLNIMVQSGTGGGSPDADYSVTVNGDEVCPQ